MLNRYVFSFRLKVERVSADLTDSGRLFHTVGPATEKARSPNLVFVHHHHHHHHLLLSVFSGQP